MCEISYHKLGLIIAVASIKTGKLTFEYCGDSTICNHDDLHTKRDHKITHDNSLLIRNVVQQ
jgi:hypothetical protein